MKVMRRVKKELRDRDPVNELPDEHRANKARRASQWAETRDRKDDDDDTAEYE
jgi:hypothetical protein